MHVLFVEPAFPVNQMEFVRALHSVGAAVTAIGETPWRGLPSQLHRNLDGYEQVPSVTHEPSLLEAVRRIQDREWVDRLEATVESHVMAAAHVREACSIPGTSTRTAFLCRDKPAMKEVLREAGVPCAQSIGATDAEAVREFAREVGLPVILKPHDAAGAAGTFRAADDDELEAAIRATGVEHGHATAVEEFVEGHEAFYDTLTCRGEVVHDFISHYYPGVLEAMRTRWISPQIVVTNRMGVAEYDEVIALGKRVIDVLGIETSATHMEWFFGPKGLKFSEIGCRPPGVRVWDLYAAANDIDIYREWAKLIVFAETDAQCSRRHAAGMIALRPDCDGEITGCEGVDEIERAFRDNIIDMHVPRPGTPTRSVADGYMANAWLRMRHSDYDTLRQMLDRVGETVKVHAR